VTDLPSRNVLVFPDLFDSAEVISAASQKKFLLSRVSEFGLMILAAVLGELSKKALWHIGPWAAVTCFAVALMIRISRVGDEAEKRWYEARAAAESVKSSSWKFAVGGGAYPLSDSHAADNFSGELREILKLLPKLDVAASTTGPIITSSMMSLRASSLPNRVKTYLQYRVDDQSNWYRNKAEWNKRQSQRWFIALVAVEGAAVILGIVRATSSFDVNLLGVFAATAGGVAAWRQSKNYSYLSESYAVTTYEIQRIKGAIESVQGEDQWSQAVQDSESGFSREHTLWISRAHFST
jgi:hypothetical protein